MADLTREDITKAVEKGIDNKLGQFYIEREKHYKHHQFIEGLIKLFDTSKAASVSIITITIITALAGLAISGAVVWIKKKMSGG